MIEDNVSRWETKSIDEIMADWTPDETGDETIRHLIRGRREEAGSALVLVDPTLHGQDRLGRLRMIWGIGRDRYRVPAGLYGVGKPGPDSPVLVTGNYKWSFDALRTVLGGRDAYLLVLDTGGINVWCASGKGTFGSVALIQGIISTGLDGWVRHRTLILPQLGAVSMEPHLVRQKIHWQIRYGPVRAEDLPRYLERGEADEAMRQVRFNLADRLRMVPVEIKGSLRILAGAALFFGGIFWLAGMPAPWMAGLAQAGVLVFSLLAGLGIFSILLPWFPFRSFGAGGLVSGLLVLPAVLALAPVPQGMALIHLGYSTYLAFTLTGSSTFTSLSGVEKEGSRVMGPAGLAIVLGLLVLLYSLWR